MLAAKWWASNVVIMSAADPWRSHFALVPLAALLAPRAADLESWLRHAHGALGRSALETSVYDQARLELLSQEPPWFARDGFASLKTHDEAWSVQMRINEMARLLDEIRGDCALTVGPARGFGA